MNKKTINTTGLTAELNLTLHLVGKKIFGNIFLAFLTFMAISSTSIFAQEKKMVKDWMHVKVFLKNDTVVEGYLHNSTAFGGYGVTRYIHEPTSLDAEMRLNDMEKIFQKDRKISNQDIDSMITWNDKRPQLTIKWEPHMTNFAYGNNDPIFEDHLIMLKVVYRGKYVTGYIINHFGAGYKCLYKTADMPCAKAFLNLEKKFSERRRKTLQEEFSEYPNMEEYIKTLDKQIVKDNPFVILEELDKAIKSLE